MVCVLTWGLPLIVPQVAFPYLLLLPLLEFIPGYLALNNFFGHDRPLLEKLMSDGAMIGFHCLLSFGIRLFLEQWARRDFAKQLQRKNV